MPAGKRPTTKSRLIRGDGASDAPFKLGNLPWQYFANAPAADEYCVLARSGRDRIAAAGSRRFKLT